VRCCAAEVVARIAKTEDIINLLAQSQKSLNAEHGTFMACRLLASRLELSFQSHLLAFLAVLENAIRSRAWFTVIEVHELCHILCPEHVILQRIEDQAFCLGPLTIDMDPGESLARSRLCAAAAIRASSENIRVILIGENDELAVAVIETLLRSIKKVQPELEDDFPDLLNGRSLQNSHKNEEVACHQELSLLAESALFYCCTSYKCGPTRRALTLRLALRTVILDEATCSKNEKLGLQLLERRELWALSEVKAVSLQLAAAFLEPSFLVQPILKDAQNVDDVLLRRGACRALGIAPQTLLRCNELFDVIMDLCCNDSDTITQTSSARALVSVCCSPSNHNDCHLRGDEIAPHAAWRRAKASFYHVLRN